MVGKYSGNVLNFIPEGGEKKMPSGAIEARLEIVLPAHSARISADVASIPANKRRIH